MATRKLEVVITGDASSLEKALGKAGGQGRSFAKTLGKAGVAGAVLGLGAAVKIGVGEFMEAQKVTAQTNAVLKSTGGVANVTTKEVQGLSEALMKKSGVDDEAIQSGQNMLLTFTKIRNETGAGNKIFDAATKATLNLSVAMGKDMQSSAVLVGKALNDPIKGIGALSRVGVQLTADQKDMIKTMVAAGDTAGAQKVILKELETQFGGSAEAAGKTFGGQINIAKQSLMNLAGDGVAKLMPQLMAFSNWISGTALPWIKTFVGGLTGNDSVKGAFAGIKAFLEGSFFPAIKGMVTVFGDALAAVKRVLDSKKEELAVIFGGIKSAAEGIYTVFNAVIIPALKFIFKAGGPFDLAFGLAIDIVAGLVKAIGKIVGAVKTVVEGISDFWKGAGGKAFRSVFDAMEDAIAPIVTAFQAIVDSVKWLIENIPKMPKVDSPLHDTGGTNSGLRPVPRGDGSGLNLMGASPVMAPFAAGAASYGLQVTSGLRPGAITANGTPSDHGIGKALDVAGPAAGMSGFFRSLLGNRSVKQAFYDPLGSIFGGIWSSYREGGHSDHVHVATYDKGGALMPGWTLAFNGTGRPERVVGPGSEGDIVIKIGEVEIARAVRNGNARLAAQGVSL